MGHAASVDGALQLHAQVEGVIVQIVHAFPHGVHGFVQRLAHGAQFPAHAPVGGVHHLQRLHLHDGARKQVPHVVVYFARYAPALGKRRQPHFVVLRGQQVAVLLRKGQRDLPLLVAQTPVPLAGRGGARRAPRHEDGRHAQQGGSGREGMRAEAQRRHKRHQPRKTHGHMALALQDVCHQRQKRQEDRERKGGGHEGKRHGKPNSRCGTQAEATRHHHGAQQSDHRLSPCGSEQQQQQPHSPENGFVKRAVHRCIIAVAETADGRIEPAVTKRTPCMTNVTVAKR